MRKYSLVEMAYGFAPTSMAARTVDVLARWQIVMSPTQALIFTGLFILALIYVVFMFPGSGLTRSRSRSDHGEERVAGVEPGSEPPPSRYPMNARSLGARYPGLFETSTYRPEGILYWLFDRCHRRVVRGNRMLTNRTRQDGLQDMLKLCARGLSEEESRNMADNLASLTDLTDDEFSPRAQLTEQMVVQQCNQGAAAFGIAARQVRHMQEAEMDRNGEPVESAEGRFARYQRATESEVSDPAYWHEVHGHRDSESDVEVEVEVDVGSNRSGHEGDAATDPSDSDGPETIDECRRRYRLLQRHEVSDGELWQQWHDEDVLHANQGYMAETSHRLDLGGNRGDNANERN